MCYNRVIGGEGLLINFNVEKLDQLLFDFYSITGITISVWSADFRQLSFQPRRMPAFCAAIKSSERGKHACFLSDKKLCTECSKSRTPTTHHCHAGLIDVAFPITFKEQILGYIMFGQIADKSREEMGPMIGRLAAELGISPQTLEAGYGELVPYNESVIASAAAILKLATRYLWLSDYIEIGYDATASRIDDYIQKHLGEPLSVAALSKACDISKKHLYEVAHKHFGMPIGEYVAAVRIREAKRLLATTEDSVQEIAVAVGIQDYNYFAKFFRLRVGVPPLKYRKESHFLPENESTEMATR